MSYYKIINQYAEIDLTFEQVKKKAGITNSEIFENLKSEYPNLVIDTVEEIDKLLAELIKKKKIISFNKGFKIHPSAKNYEGQGIEKVKGKLETTNEKKQKKLGIYRTVSLAILSSLLTSLSVYFGYKNLRLSESNKDKDETIKELKKEIENLKKTVTLPQKTTLLKNEPQLQTSKIK